MKAAIVLGAIIAMLAGAQAAAGGRACRSSHEACGGPPPIRGASVSVLESDQCWRGCTAQCGAGFQVCRRHEPMSGCVLGNDYCTRDCLRVCRRHGGPFFE